MRKFISVATIAALLAGTPALAKDMHCNFNKDYKSWFDRIEFKRFDENFKLIVKDTYSGRPESINTKDYNKYVNVKWGSEELKGLLTNIMARPRTSAECLNKIESTTGAYTSGKHTSTVWYGGYCNTSKHLETGKNLHVTEFPYKFPAALKDEIYYGGGYVLTTTKKSWYFGFYRKGGIGYEQIGGCVEDR